MPEKDILQRYNNRAKKREDISESKLATSTLERGYWRGGKSRAFCRLSGKSDRGSIDFSQAES